MYILNDFSTVADLPFQIYNPELVLTGKLHLQTRIAIAFSYDILYILQAQPTTHQTTPLLPRMLHCTLQSARYDPMLISLSR